MLFGAALPNFGVRRLLEGLVELAPPPAPRADIKDEPRPVDAPFSGLVFKVQANMDRNHRDRVAFVRVCSGRFERGMVLTHAATGRPFATKYAQSMFGADRETVDVAYPGDVIGLVNATALRPGDTLYDELSVEFPPIPSFAPEHFAVVRSKDASKHKQFRKGIDQLATEGVVQVLASNLRGDQAPVLAAVGPLQFDVVLNRLEHEFGARAELEHLGYTLARRTDAEGAAGLAGVRGTEVLTRRLDGALLALFTDKWRLAAIQRDHQDVLLETLVASTDDVQAPAPPSTGTMAPVTIDARSLSSQAATSATSRGSAMCPSGIAALMRSTTPGVAASQVSIISVAVPPGVMPLTRMCSATPGHGGGLGDAVERALHGAVGGEFRVRAAAADARGVDDRPAAVPPHQRGLGRHRGPVGPEVHRELLVDVLLARGRRAGPGAGSSAPLLNAPSSRPCRSPTWSTAARTLGAVGQVQGHGVRGAAVGADLCDDAVEGLGVRGPPARPRPPRAANSRAAAAPMPRLAPVMNTTLPASRPIDVRCRCHSS